MKAIAFIDVQNDFIDGSLGVGQEKFQPCWKNIEALCQENIFAYKVFTKDYHPVDHCSFKEFGGLWPAHCVVGTMGCEFYWKVNNYIKNSEPHAIINKAYESDREEYGTNVLEKAGSDMDIKEVHIVGLCTDYCVSESAIMTKRANPEIEVIVHLACCCEISRDTAAAAIEKMKNAGIKVI